MNRHLTTYLTLIGLELLLVAFVRRQTAGEGGIRPLIGAVPRTLGAATRDVLVAGATWTTWIAFARLWSRVVPHPPSRAVASLIPAGAVDAVLWVLVSCCAGFAEELAFRGALQRWGERRFHRAAFSIAFQAVAFGIVHGYQGVEPIARITMYGVLFGVVARWRGSLVPPMLAHAWTDISAGLLHI